jgi:hypothetical protein
MKARAAIECAWVTDIDVRVDVMCDVLVVLYCNAGSGSSLTKAKLEMKTNSIRQRSQSVCEHNRQVLVPACRPECPYVIAARCINEMIVKSFERLQKTSAQA